MSADTPEMIADPLPRQFGAWTSLFVVSASMVGTGILVTSGYTIRDTQNLGVVLALWALGGFLALMGALSITELATAMPRVGGEYAFVRAAFGPAWAFTYGWATFLFGFSGPIALVAHGGVEYLLAPLKASPSVTHQFPWLTFSWTTTFIASGVIVLFTWSHCLGQKQSAQVQAVTTILKLVILVGFVVFGLLLGTGDWGNFQVGKAITEQSPATLASALVWILYGYSGWNGAVYLAGEIQNPSRNLPISVIGGCIAVTALYLALNITYGYAIHPESLRGFRDADVEAVAELASRQLFGSHVAGVLSIAIGLGTLATLSAFILTGPRVSFAMARDGLFPRYAGWLHPTRLTPVAASLSQAAVALVLLWSGQFSTLLDFTSVGLALLAVLTIAPIFIFRWRGEPVGTFRVPLFPLPPLLFVVATGWIVALAKSPIMTLASIASLALGLPLYYLSNRRR